MARALDENALNIYTDGSSFQTPLRGVGAWLLIWVHHGGEAPDPEWPPMKYPKRSQYQYAKSRYRVRNWREYEVGLQRRGDLTVSLGHGGECHLPVQDDPSAEA